MEHDNPYRQNNDQNPYRADNTVRSTGPDAAAAAAPPQPPAKGKRTALIILLAVGGFFILVLGFIGGIFYFVMSLMKSSDAYIEGVARAKKHPAVIQTLGEPMKEGLFTTGSINLHNDDGTARLQIPLSGPKGSGTVYVSASKTAGVWTFHDVHFNTSNGKTPIYLGPAGEKEHLPAEKPQ